MLKFSFKSSIVKIHLLKQMKRRADVKCFAFALHKVVFFLYVHANKKKNKEIVDRKGFACRLKIINRKGSRFSLFNSGFAGYITRCIYSFLILHCLRLGTDGRATGFKDCVVGMFYIGRFTFDWQVANCHPRRVFYWPTRNALNASFWKGNQHTQLLWHIFHLICTKNEESQFCRLIIL